MCVERQYLVHYRKWPGSVSDQADVTTPLNNWPDLPKGRIISLAPERPFHTVEYGPCEPESPPEIKVIEKEAPEWVKKTIMWRVDYLHDVQDKETMAYKYTIVFLCPVNP